MSTPNNSEPLPSEIAQVKKVLASPLAKAELHHELRETKRPVGWKRRTTASYYRLRFAEEFRAVIDSMLSDVTKGDVVYLYKVYCTPEYGMNPNTLYTRVYQSMKFLVDELDKDGTAGHPPFYYSDALSTIEIRRERNVGVRLSFMRDIKLGKPFVPFTVIRQDQSSSWQQEIEQWIATTPAIGSRKVISKLCLNPTEIEELRIKFANMPSISASVSSDSIKIMVLPPED